MSHNSYFVICALKKLFSKEFFKSKKFKNFSFWMDGGPHFTTKELFGYFCRFAIKGKKINWNLFGEYHGKNPCDTRFSQISAMLRAHTNNQNNFKIEKTADVIIAIRNQQNLINEMRAKSNKLPVDSEQILLNVSKLGFSKKILLIKQFKNIYYSYTVNNENKVCASFLSGEGTSKIWNISFKSVIEKKKNKNIVTPDVNNEKDDNLIWLSQKRKFIKINKLKRNKQPEQIEVDLFCEPPPSKRRRLIKLSEMEDNKKRKRTHPLTLYLDEEDVYIPQNDPPKKKRKIIIPPTPNVRNYLLILNNKKQLQVIKLFFWKFNYFSSFSFSETNPK
jgi:hypothetical protein